ncbi:MAG TPA: GTPase [Porticoccaceae bacterium]|nr:GTPase [Porticoccaceae bacterium]HCO60624.1 GTPase [Porticoccaceae bacterium]
MGAAGRDFHNFNRVYRADPTFEVLAFSAAQIPKIEGRVYPPSLSGPLYPDGIPIITEDTLGEFCRNHEVAQVVFAYSDISHADVMHKASIALAAGSDFVLLGPQQTMIEASVPVVAVSAVRTGCGKSQTSRYIAAYLKQQGLRVAAIRHPMPYGELGQQAVQRFAKPKDLDGADCTIEEREEYEPYLQQGVLVFAGIDYEAILQLAQKEADLIIWDGGNNDFPFVRPNLHLVLVDPLRPGHECSHHPGEAVLRMAHVVIVPKVNVAAEVDIQTVIQAANSLNPMAPIIKAESQVRLDDSDAVRGRRVLVIEDGPTTTHGGMAYGAGYIASVQAGAREIVDPRAGAAPALKKVFTTYPHLTNILPAVGYFPEQLRALEASINAIDAEVVVSATPCDLNHLITVNKPMVRARYEYADAPGLKLAEVLDDFIRQRKLSI